MSGMPAPPGDGIATVLAVIAVSQEGMTASNKVLAAAVGNMATAIENMAKSVAELRDRTQMMFAAYMRQQEKLSAIETMLIRLERRSAPVSGQPQDAVPVLLPIADVAPNQPADDEPLRKVTKEEIIAMFGKAEDEGAT